MKYIIELMESNLNRDNQIELNYLQAITNIVLIKEKCIHKTDKLIFNALVYLGKKYIK